ncbi:MAG: PAS domain-containing sensor histidine kinase [Burkholderiaceae bacterium]
MKHDLNILQQRWAMALQSAGFGVWDLDPRVGQVHYSPQWKAMLGYASSDEADSTETWRARVHPDDLQAMVEALSDHLEGRSEAYEREFRLRAADGSYRWVLSRGRVVERDTEAVALRMVGTLTDMTDRRNAEALRAERDRAEAASRAKTEFLSRMSHELRTPLNAVLGFAQLLSVRIGSTDIEQQRSYVGSIEKAGWHLLTMINDVLDLSRLESGDLQLQTRPLELVPLLRSVIERMEPVAQDRGVEIRWAAPSPDATVLADPERLTQVFTNLLGNAIKYNREGGAATLAIARRPGAWKISVDDTGIGIPAAQIPHLFEPFNRLGQARPAVDGVGIGLVLSRLLLDRMGGRMRVRSTEGVGSSFEVILPAGKPGDIAHRPSGSGARTGQGARPRPGKSGRGT